jgi:hypothetical protein
MARPLRLEFPGALYHVIARGVCGVSLGIWVYAAERVGRSPISPQAKASLNTTERERATDVGTILPEAPSQLRFQS